MRLILRNTFLFLFTLASLQVFAQPANDDCSTAAVLAIGADEASAVRIAGDTRGATQSTTPASVCSGSWFADDIWYSVPIDQDVPVGTNLVIKAYFDQAVSAADVPAIGMAVYTSCAAEVNSVRCFSSADPLVNSMVFNGGECLEAGNTYYIRVWSGVSPTDNSGTLELAVYLESEEKPDNVLWEEDFNGGLNGWATAGLGECRVNPDSSANAVFVHFPNAVINQGNYTNAVAISRTFCNGVAGVDSDFNDNMGTPNGGTGSVPTANGAENTADYILQSPAIPSGDYDVAGLTLSFSYSLRAFNNTRFFASWRSKNAADPDWAEWTDVEFATDITANVSDEGVARFFMPGTINSDSLQVRFVYRANYYYFAVDDVRIVETEGNNLRVQSNFYAIAPWATIPSSQVFPYPVLSDIYNAGALTQTNVSLNHTVMQDGGAEIYNVDLGYGAIGADSTAENKAFPTLVTVPAEVATYTGTYTLTADSTDFDASDNSLSYNFGVGTSEYAYENGPVNGFGIAAPADGISASWVSGNHFYFPNGSQVKAKSIVWGIGNGGTLPDLAGHSVNILLLKWTDTNGNEIAEFDEREFLSFANYEFVGDEVSLGLIETPIDNFNNPGEDLFLEDGGQYLAILEYVTEDQVRFFAAANDLVDYSAAIFAADSAFINGEQAHRTYINVVGIPTDGNVSGMDYELKEFGDDGREFFGNNFAWSIRMIVEDINVGTQDPLEETNLISLYPNPTSDILTVDLEFAENLDGVVINIMDVNGKQIVQRELDSVQKQKETFNVSQLAAGNYMIQVITEAGQRTQSFVVSR